MSTAHAHAARHAPLVLVADDDEEARALTGFRLRRAGYQAIEARDGFEALRLWRRHAPSLVLLDASLPGLDGHAVGRIVGHAVPVLFLPPRGDEHELLTSVGRALAERSLLAD